MTLLDGKGKLAELGGHGASGVLVVGGRAGQ